MPLRVGAESAHHDSHYTHTYMARLGARCFVGSELRATSLKPWLSIGRAIYCYGDGAVAWYAIASWWIANAQRVVRTYVQILFVYYINHIMKTIGNYWRRR